MAGVRRCALTSCTSTSKNSTISFFRFPRDADRLKKWIDFVRRPELLAKDPSYCYNNLKMCGKHFEEKMFLNDLMNRLQHSAYPTIFDPNNTVKSKAVARICCVSYCGDEHGPFVPFPKDNVTLLTTWLKNIDDFLLFSLSDETLLESKVICINHFETKFHEADGTLSSDAVPTLFVNIKEETQNTDFDDTEIKSSVMSEVILTPDISNHTSVSLSNQLLQDTASLITDIKHETFDEPQEEEQSILKSVLVSEEPVLDYEPFVTNETYGHNSKSSCSHCRLCSYKFPLSSLVPLFNEMNEQNDYQDMLEMCVPGMVRKDDKLPQEICELCLSKLKDCCLMIKGFVQADGELKKLFKDNLGIKTNSDIIIPQSNTDLSITTVRDTIIIKEPEIDDVSIKRKVVDNITQNKTRLLTQEPINCLRCSESFKTVQEYRSHMLTHKLFKCDDCQTFFNTKIRLKVHRREHGNLKAKRKKRFRKIQTTDAKNKKKNERRFLCSNCGKAFTDLSTLKNHELAIHREERPHVCDICARAFKRPNALRDHKLRHTGERNYMCQRCGNRFVLHAHLRSHMRSHCNVMPRKNRFFCHICSAGFSYMLKLKRHIRSIHEVKQLLSYPKCRLCNVEVPRSMLTHMNQEHPGSNPFECEICKKDFNRMILLTDHMRLHTGERPFKCDVCAKNFMSVSALKSHLKNTHKCGKEKFDALRNQCDVCKLRFKSVAFLTRHVKEFHTDQNSSIKLDCDLCDKQFENVGLFKKHMWQHENGLHVCGDCGKAYRYECNLRVHWEKHCTPNN